MSNEADPLSLASAIETEAGRFGRVLSPTRALEIAREIQRYDHAIREIAEPGRFDQEPSDFLKVLIQLAHS